VQYKVRTTGRLWFGHSFGVFDTGLVKGLCPPYSLGEIDLEKDFVYT